MAETLHLWLEMGLSQITKSIRNHLEPAQ